MLDIKSQLCSITDLVHDYFYTDIGQDKKRLLDHIKDTRSPDSGIESLFTSIVAQVIDGIDGLISETRARDEDVIVYDSNTFKELFRIELKAGIQSSAISWYLNGASQYPGVHCIFFGPADLIEKVKPFYHRVVGNWVVGVLLSSNKLTSARDQTTDHH